MFNILIGLTGSVASLKALKLVNEFESLGDIKIVATKAAYYFLLQSGDLAELKTKAEIFVDESEWPVKYSLGDEILHIELRRWASCFVIAPLDANSLAKITHGMCDNLLTSVARAWDWSKPMFLAPAMNTLMMEHPITDMQLDVLKTWGAIVVPPQCKKLACGDIGIGAMASIGDIYKRVNEKLRWAFPLKKCSGMPINHHPGAFGFHRKKNHHTGIDLYTNDGEEVFAVEDGTVVKVDYFTGPKVGHDWWEETWGVMIEGASGVVNYGEVTPHVKLGDKVSRQSLIGHVKRVLFQDKLRPDIPGHSTSMLHLELYKQGTRDFADWHDPQKNPDLIDPTPYLMSAEWSPRKTLTWDNTEGKNVG